MLDSFVSEAEDLRHQSVIKNGHHEQVTGQKILRILLPPSVSLSVQSLKRTARQPQTEVSRILITTMNEILLYPGCTLRLKSIRPFADLSYMIFEWSKMWIEIIENSPILQKLLRYVGYHSSRNLDPILPVVLNIQTFKVGSFLFYLIKCPFFGNFDFEGLYFLGH